MAQTAEVMENQAQEFIDYAIKKGFTISQEFIDAVIFELKTVNLWRESVSLKSYKMGLSAAIDSGKILAPVQKPIDIGSAATALQNTFPPVLTERQLARQLRDALANAGVAEQSGRKTEEDRRQDSERASRNAQTVRQLSNHAELKLELKTRLAAAETAMSDTPRNHARNYAERARLKAVIAADKKYDPIR